MEEAHLYLILILGSVVFLNSNFKLGTSLEAKRKNQEYNIHPIDFLSQYCRKPKNYHRGLQNLKNFGFHVVSKIRDNNVILEYTFPLLKSHKSTFKISINPNNFSSIVSEFGCHNSCFGPVDDKRYQLASTNADFLQKNMNKDGFYFNHFGEKGFGINYDHIIEISVDLTSRIASLIVSELKAINKDDYITRVQAALNFVQCIPYGVPNFDKGDYCYFGFSLPHESLVLNYSDCDSKSILFAGILYHLIDPKNIILVSCVIQEGGHMITGIAGLPYGGQYIDYQDKKYLLIETTSPIPIDMQPSNKFEQVEVYQINLV